MVAKKKTKKTSSTKAVKRTKKKTQPKRTPKAKPKKTVKAKPKSKPKTAGKKTPQKKKPKAAKRVSIKKAVKKKVAQKKGAKKTVKKTKSATTSRYPIQATVIKVKKINQKSVKPSLTRQRSATRDEEAQVSSPPLTVGELRKVKIDLTRKDLTRFHRLLLEKRAIILGDVQTMETDARGKNDGGNLSNMPVHMADIGSDNYEQEFTLGLVESERRLLREIDEALERIRDGIYGVCLERGVPIRRARLEAKPWAKYCIEVARERERRGKY